MDICGGIGWGDHAIMRSDIIEVGLSDLKALNIPTCEQIVEELENPEIIQSVTKNSDKNGKFAISSYHFRAIMMLLDNARMPKIRFSLIWQNGFFRIRVLGVILQNQDNGGKHAYY